ncbi:hypothetical protein [Luteibacter yeojuensis]|uniref:Uncharacterized protein n=1 Tax=Luteibacter yeojuensis TaxID=345309 RepID=A0A7X5QSJ8_9GAMM|nr:hypothetical protein [Luteibacter yeojuensis]NID14633.1 hypothetical protein [Luteibacter yeojuensis]
MRPGRTARVRPATNYAAACTEDGYEICRDGVLVKCYRLAAICYLLTGVQRHAIAVEFAEYDIRNEAFMLA